MLKNIKISNEYLLYKDSVSLLDKPLKMDSTSLVVSNLQNQNDNRLNLSEYNSLSQKQISQNKVNKIVNSVVEKHDKM